MKFATQLIFGLASFSAMGLSTRSAQYDSTGEDENHPVLSQIAEYPRAFTQILQSNVEEIGLTVSGPMKVMESDTVIENMIIVAEPTDDTALLI